MVKKPHEICGASRSSLGLIVRGNSSAAVDSWCSEAYSRTFDMICTNFFNGFFSHLYIRGIATIFTVLVPFLDINSQNSNSWSNWKLWQEMVKIQGRCEQTSNIPSHA